MRIFAKPFLQIDTKYESFPMVNFLEIQRALGVGGMRVMPEVARHPSRAHVDFGGCLPIV